MRRTDPGGVGGAPAPPRRFILYVEGPRDREILRRWANAVEPNLGRAVEGAAMILGGRQPARAIEHFQQVGGGAAGARGICVLDRDHRPASDPLPPSEPGLEFFTWQRRHIESYLLVPDAILRSLGSSRSDRRAERLFREHLPEPADEDALLEVDAKRLLHDKGPLARGLGCQLPVGRIARAMRESELHPDVLDLIARMRRCLGIPEHGPRVVPRGR